MTTTTTTFQVHDKYEDEECYHPSGDEFPTLSEANAYVQDVLKYDGDYNARIIRVQRTEEFTTVYETT